MVEIICEEEIENVNCAMVMALECANRMFDTQYVIENGRITEIIRKKKIIKAK